MSEMKKIDERIFKTRAIDKSRFHIRGSEADSWPEAERLHGWLDGLSGSRATIGEMKAASFGWDVILLLVQKGGLAEVDADHWYSLDKVDEQFIELDRALRKGGLRHRNWKPVYVAKGVHPESSEIISRVLGDEGGHLSGTTRLVQGPMNEVAEIHFRDEDKPTVAVHYVVESEDHA